MQSHDPSGEPERPRRRTLFSGRNESPPPPMTSTPPPSIGGLSSERAEAVMRAYHEMIQEQLEEGLRRIQFSANQLMHEIASEVWAAGGGDKQELQGSILETLARDQSIRSLMAHSDERFQALAVRTARLEDTLNMLAEGIRTAREDLSRGVEALQDAQGSPAARGVEDVRHRLDQVTRQVVLALDTIAERDRAIIDAVQQRVSDHGELVSTETSRVAQALESYVQQGVAAMGQLAGDVEGQLQLMHDRMAMESRDLLTAVESAERRSIEHQQAGTTEMTRMMDTRIIGLAELVRSDSIALRDKLVMTAAAQNEEIARVLEGRLTQVTDTVTSTTSWVVEELPARLHEEVERTIATRMDDAVSSIDRNMVRMADTLEGQLERLNRSVGERAEEAINRSGMRTEETIMQALDARMAALAKMIRSDNESLARQIVADQDASKQSLRAMKELQASLPAEVIETIQRRMDDLGESVAKSQEMLAQRIDRMAAQIGQRYDDDFQSVIGRMGDAMHALASLGRVPDRPSSSSERIELE